MAESKYIVQVAADVAMAKKEILELKSRINELEKGDHKVKLDIDAKLLESTLNKLDSMLGALGKNGDFSQFENLGSSINTAVANLKEMRDALVTIDSEGNIGNKISASITELNSSLTPLIENLKKVSELQGEINTVSNNNANSTSSNRGGKYTKQQEEYRSNIDDLIRLSKEKAQLEKDLAKGVDGSKYHNNRITEIHKETEALQRQNQALEVSENFSKRENNRLKKEQSRIESKKNQDIESYKRNQDRKSANSEVEKLASEKEIQVKNAKKEYKKLVSDISDLNDKRSRLEIKRQTGKSSVSDNIDLQDIEQSIAKQKVSLEAKRKLLKEEKAFLQEQDNLLSNNEEKNNRKITDTVDQFNVDAIKKQADTVKSAIESSTTSFNKIKLPDGFSKEVSDIQGKLLSLNETFKTESKDLSGDAFSTRLEQYKNDVSSVIKELSNLENFSKKGKLVDPTHNHLGILGNETSSSEIISNVTAKLSQSYDILKTTSKVNMSTGVEQMVFKLRDASGEISQLALNYDTATGKIVQSTSKLGNEGTKIQNFFTGFKERLKGMSQYWLANLFDPYQLVSNVGNMINKVVELDDALVDLKKTTTMSDNELNKFYTNSSKNAKEAGTTTKDFIQQAADWSRLGYSSNYEATNMAKKSSKFAAISPGMSTDEASSGLISIMKAYNVGVDQVESQIMDKINTLGNNFAVTNANVVTGLEKSAAALSSTGTSLEDAMALFVAGDEILQDEASMGTALRTISLRVRGFSEETGELDDNLKTIKGDVIDLTKTAAHPDGVSLFTDSSQEHYKSLVTYLGEISDIWDEISEKNQNKLLDKLFGKTRAQAGSSILTNFDTVREALAKMETAEGSSDAEMANIQESLSYKINALKETWTGLLTTLSRSDFGVIIDGLTGISELITTIVGNVGLIQTVLGGAGGLLASKTGLGKHSFVVV